jgi:hypothetical protein
MLPMTGSNWVSNNKKVQAQWLAGKKAASVGVQRKKERP